MSQTKDSLGVESTSVISNDSLQNKKTRKQIRKEKKAKKNLRFSIIGGPGYTPDYGALLGGSALFTFSTKKTDSVLKRSVLPVAFSYIFSGGGIVMIRPQLFFNSNKFRVYGKMLFKRSFDNYYGIGFEKNSIIERGKETTQYRSINYEFSPIFYFRYKETNLFYGGSLDISSKTFNDPSLGVQNDEDYIADGGDVEGLNYFNLGIGANFSYDTRDIPANTYKGMLIELSATIYPEFLGSTKDFAVYHLQYKQFKELKFIAERTVLAWMADARFTSGDVPLTDLSMIGSPFNLRGYYLGQYRDKNAFYTLIEYRQMINAGDETKFKKILSKLGFAAWVGMGSIAPDFRNWSEIMPNFGAGLRIEVQPRMNFRIDVGHDALSGQTLFYFNMTEAF